MTDTRSIAAPAFTGWSSQPLQQHFSDIPPVVDDTPVVDAPVDTPDAGAPADDLGTFGEHGAYVKELRAESAGHRTKAAAAAAAAKKYDDAFAGYDDDEKAVWLELATGLLNDPTATADRLQEIADRARGPKAPEPVAGDDAPLTKAQLDKVLKEREDAADLDKRTAAIVTQAEGLGYKNGSVAYRTLLITAQENGGDIAGAHAAIQAERQGIIDAYVAAQAAAADGTPTPAGAAAPAGQERKITTFNEAGDAFRELLAARRKGPQA